MNELKTYWRNLQPREQKSIRLAVIVTALVLAYLLLWKPWHEKIDHYYSVVPQKRADLKWMMAHRDIAAKLGGNSAINKTSNKGILTVVESTATKAGLRANIKQMSPGDTENEARLWFTQVEFNKWLRWTADLKKSKSISVKSVNIQNVESGVVDVRATFVR